MATERRPLASLALLVALSGGCDPIVDRCAAGTLLVAVTLNGDSAAADQLDVFVALDGAASGVTSMVQHTPGTATGNLVIGFPNGYPRDSSALVEVTARAGLTALGFGRASATLGPGCQATTLQVDALAGDGGSDSDGAAGDLSAPDALGGPDLASVDLQAASLDLTVPPDLACPGGGVELCFNGADDDCDGMTDCADPDCAPVALCVPSVGAGFGYGTQEPAGGACPVNTSATTTYQSTDPTGGGCGGSCSC
jgi:hypothetical protein